MLSPKILRGVGTLVGSKLLPALALTLVSILLSHFLDKNNYGLYQGIWSLVSIFTILSAFGLPRYILTFGSLYHHSNKVRYSLIALVCMLGILSGAVYLAFFDSALSFTDNALVLPIIVSQSLYIIQEAGVIRREKQSILVPAALVYSLLFLAGHVLLITVTGYALTAALVVILVSSLARNLIVLLAVPSPGIAPVVLNQLQLFWFGLNDALQILTRWFDKLILLLVLSTADYAVYFNGTYEIPLIGMLLLAFQSILTRQAAEDSSPQDVLRLFKSSSLDLSAIIFPLFTLCVLFADVIIPVLLSGKYMESALLFAISSLVLPLRITSFTVLLQLRNQGQRIVAGSILDFVVAIILMVVLYPFMGLPGLALAVVAGTYAQAIYYTAAVIRTWNCRLDDLWSLKSLGSRLLVFMATGFVFRIVLGPTLLSLLAATLILGGISAWHLRRSLNAKL